MPPKKNAFFMFISSYRDSSKREGQKVLSFQELSENLSPIWEKMSEEEKNKYKVLADQHNSKINEQKENKASNTSSDSPTIYFNLEDITSTVLDSISNKDELLDKKFIILHVNSHTNLAENYYFPAEIAAVEFSLRHGVLRRYHAIVGISQIYPKGYAGGMRQISDNSHRICCWKNFPDDYPKIVSDFIAFLKVGIENDDDSHLNLPDLFTVEVDNCQSLINVNSGMNRLYAAAYPNGDSKSVFKVKSLERLFIHIRSKLNGHLNPLLLIETVHGLLQNDFYGSGLACIYHDMLDIPFKCSTSLALQWMSNICTHLHDLNSIDVSPGKHFPYNLRDGSRLFIEGDTPFPMSALRIKEKKKKVFGDDTFCNLFHGLDLEQSSYKPFSDDDSSSS